MTGPNGPTPSQAHAPGGGQEPCRMSRRRTVYPEQVSIRLRVGSLAAIERAADSEGQAPSEWLPALLRKGLDAARKRRERTA